MSESGGGRTVAEWFTFGASCAVLAVVLALIAGTHGMEYVPIVALQRMRDEVFDIVVLAPQRHLWFAPRGVDALGPSMNQHQGIVAFTVT